MKGVDPIFIFSLPRTGSTLIQRIVMSHTKVSSFAEPYFLLPFVYANKKEGIVSSYSHISAYKGFSDVVKKLPNQEDDYFKFLNEFSLNIYNSLSSDESKYFLDKTPFYIWIIPEIIKIFPDAKFIFLFRNPVQIYASILSTFSNNGFGKFYRFKKYLYDGFELISEQYDQNKDISLGINYEEFLENPEKVTKDICEYLNLDYEEQMIELFSEQDLRGRSMDPTGVKNYKRLSKSPLEKWKKVFYTSYRKNILINYLENLSDKSFVSQGYSKDDILSEVKKFKPKNKIVFFKDLVQYHLNRIIIRLNLNLIGAENVKWTRKQYMN